MKLNVLAPVNSLGYGVVGLNAVLGLHKIGHEPALWILGQAEIPEEHRQVLGTAAKRALFYDAKAPSIRVCQPFDMAQHVGKGCHASVVYFERDKLHAHEVHQLCQQDIVIASSAWMRGILEKNGIPSARIAVARPGVDYEIFYQAPLTSVTTTVFLSVGKWEACKGHDILVDVFNKAFTAGDDVALVLIAANPFLSPQQTSEWENIYKRSPLGDKVHIIPGRLPTQRHLAHMMAQADCGIFLSRAEGWNLDLAEMLAMGKHCIATNFSAHTEFVTGSSCRLVDIDKIETASDGVWFHGTGNWASLGTNQIEQAVDHMRAVHGAKQEGRLGVNHGGIDSMKKFTWENFAREIVQSVS